MKKLTVYECEICGKWYAGSNEGLTCEALGKEMPAATIGDTFEYDVLGNGKVFLFVRLCNITEEGHQAVYHFEDQFSDPATDQEAWYENDRRKITGNEMFKQICKPMIE